MKIVIAFYMDNASFVDDFHGELERVLNKVKTKVCVQVTRRPSICDVQEADDKILDSNGNTIGFIKLEET